MGGTDMDFIGLLRTLEQITRPPRMGHDDDRPLPDYEVNCLHRAPHYVIPTGMDHQCYCARPQGHPLDDFGHRPHICPCGQLWADLPTKSSASNHTGTGAEPEYPPNVMCVCGDLIHPDMPSVEVEADGGLFHWNEAGGGHRFDADMSNAPADLLMTGSGPSEVSGHSPVPPSEGRPPHPVPREQRQGTYCEDYETDGCSVDVCPDGCYHALKFRDDAVAEWIGGAVPVICGVLARHVPVNTSKHTPSVFCNSITGQYCHEYADWQAWREHIAPIIANALAPHDK